MSETYDSINRICAQLEGRGVHGIPGYKQRLIDNSANANFEDFLLEGRAALMFRKVGFGVTLREAPDLALEFNGQQLYAEVKHFRLKEQDLIDDARMSEPGEELVPYGDTREWGEDSAHEQVYNVAKSKTKQYKHNAPNILVVESSSPNCIEEPDIQTAVNAVNEAVCSDGCPSLHRLNGILLVSLKSWNLSQKRNAFFYPTVKPNVPLTPEVINLLSSIRLG